MKLTLTSTERMVTINNVPCRVWEGTTADGVRCVAFVRRIAVRGDARLDEFENTLTNVPELMDVAQNAGAIAAVRELLG